MHIPRRGELLSLGIALLMLLLIAGVSFQEWGEYSQARTRVTLRRDLLRSTEQLLSTFKDAETGQRGYLLTGQPRYLEPYSRALAKVAPELDHLARAASAAGRHQDQVQRLRELARRKMDELQGTIDVRNRAGLPAALDIVRTDLGKQTMDDLRGLCERIEEDEYAGVLADTRDAQARGTRTRLITAFGSVVLFGMLAFATFVIHRATTRREQLITDLADQKSKTEQVRDVLQTTLMSIGDGVIATDKAGVVTLMNPVAAAITRWPESDAVGRTLESVFHIVNESTREAVENPALRALREGRIVGLANHTVLLTRDGTELPIDDSGAPIRSPDGQVTGVVLVFRDVTQRRASERERERLLEEAKAARAHLQSLFLQAPALINIQRGPDHVFELAHPLFTQMLGGRDVTGLPMREGLSELQAPGFLDHLDEVHRSGRPYFGFEEPVRLPLPDGTSKEAFLNFICNPWYEAGGRIAGVMTFAIDVTEQVLTRRQLEETRRKLVETAKLESLGVLAGGVAHDFNNLLVGIMGNASLALDILPREHRAAPFLEGVLKSSERAADLARQMLAYSGRGRILIQLVDVSALIRELVTLVQSAIPRTVELRLSLAKDLPPVEADTAQMQQLLMNLVINAAESYGDKPGTVFVRTALEAVDQPLRSAAGGFEIGPGAYVCLEIRDAGCGMDGETAARIFDPFFTTKFTGRGLGLSAALGIVRAHHGLIDVDSRPGRGSTFRILLPAAAASLPEPVAPKQLGALDGAGTVLVVDDEETVRRTAQNILERYGYRVLIAVNGLEAVEVLRRDPQAVSVVMLDLTMPVMSGIEALPALKAIRPDLPILLATGFDEVEAAKSFQPGDLAGVLQKPYTAPRVAEAVKSATTRRAGAAS